MFVVFAQSFQPTHPGEAPLHNPARPSYWMISTVMGVVCVTPPPVAVTVIVWLPIDALLLALTVNVEVPPPGAAIDAGLKVKVSPLPPPDAVKVTAELKLPDVEEVIVDVPELLRATVSEVGDADTAKPAGDEAVTVRETVAV